MCLLTLCSPTLCAQVGSIARWAANSCEKAINSIKYGMRSLFFSAGEDIHPSSVQHGMDLPSNFDARKEPHPCSLIHGDTGQDFQASSLMQHGINAWQELYQCSSVHGGNNENMDVYQDLNSFPLGKYEEIGAPQVEEFCYITDNTYFKEEVLQIESAVLNYLKFEMTAPTAKWRSVAFQYDDLGTYCKDILQEPLTCSVHGRATFLVFLALAAASIPVVLVENSGRCNKNESDEKEERGLSTECDENSPLGDKYDLGAGDV
ncbi:hypothetical protein KY289_007750 [Solanum tuberosum]|nr:hypothetical protein KY289_007750 [Solanum tuberosum]